MWWVAICGHIENRAIGGCVCYIHRGVTTRRCMESRVMFFVFCGIKESAAFSFGWQIFPLDLEVLVQLLSGCQWMEFWTDKRIVEMLFIPRPVDLINGMLCWQRKYWRIRDRFVCVFFFYRIFDKILFNYFVCTFSYLYQLNMGMIMPKVKW